MPGAPRVSRPWARFLLCLLLLLICLPAAAAGAEQIKWLTYAQTLELAPSAAKPVFIYFRAPWCHFCKKMQSQVFPEAQVSAALNRDFLAVDVDVTQERRVAEAYQVSYLPTSIFLSPQGKPVLVLRGFLPAERLLSALAYMAGGHYKKKSFQDYESQP